MTSARSWLLRTQCHSKVNSGRHKSSLCARASQANVLLLLLLLHGSCPFPSCKTRHVALRVGVIHCDQFVFNGRHVVLRIDTGRWCRRRGHGVRMHRQFAPLRHVQPHKSVKNVGVRIAQNQHKAFLQHVNLICRAPINARSHHIHYHNCSCLRLRHRKARTVSCGKRDASRLVGQYGLGDGVSAGFPPIPAP